jgi:hypothetical protein
MGSGRIGSRDKVEDVRKECGVVWGESLMTLGRHEVLQPYHPKIK